MCVFLSIINADIILNTIFDNNRFLPFCDNIIQYKKLYYLLYSDVMIVINNYKNYNLSIIAILNKFNIMSTIYLNGIDHNKYYCF